VRQRFNMAWTSRFAPMSLVPITAHGKGRCEKIIKSRQKRGNVAIAGEWLVRKRLRVSYLHERRWIRAGEFLHNWLCAIARICAPKSTSRVSSPTNGI
jgi:hypothetical protein